MGCRLPGKIVLPLGLEICLLVSYFRTSWENSIDEVTDAAILVLNEEIRELVRERGGSIALSRLIIWLGEFSQKTQL